MHCKYTFVVFFLLYAELNIADNNAWDCEKVSGGEWKCASQAPVEQPPTATTQIKGEIESPEVTLNPPSPPLPSHAFISPSKLTHTERPPEKKLNQPGFTCKTSEDEQSWSCTSSRVDAIETAKSSESSGFFTPAFNQHQERLFGELHSKLKYDPWESCSRSVRDNKLLRADDVRNTAPMHVSADYSEVFDKEVTSFFGNVEINRADQYIQSDRASYNTASDTMDAQGHVFYNENEMSLYSDTILLHLATDEARLRDVLFVTPSGPMRGSADVVYRDSKYLSRYTDTAITSCRPGNEDWVLHAERLKMNQKSGKAAAKHAWLEFKGLPVLYTPYISFPLDDRRISGILPVSVSASGENGFDLTVPFYWNMAPNYDLTLWPRYMSERGGMLGGEFRYLTPKTLSSVALEYLPYDFLNKEERFAGSIKNKSQIFDGLTTDIDLNYVSDEAYFDELNDTLGLSNDRYLTSKARLDYQTEGVLFTTRTETYQSIDKFQTSKKPYHILPEVTLNLNHSFEQWPVDIAMDNDYTYFYREGRFSGHRFNTKPSIAFPIETEISYIKPKFSLQYTQYELGNKRKSESISRILPIVSVDSGLIFEKDIKFGGSGFMHTIEPRLFYLYIPEKDQSDIPVFDSSLYDFGYSSLFRENRFNGIDRIQDANQLSFAVTSRLMDSDSGLERLNLSVGEIFYFKDRKVTLDDDAPETNNLSNLVAELSSQLTEDLSFRSAIQWSPEVNDVVRGQAEMMYKDEAGKILNLGYRYRKDEAGLDIRNARYIIQTDTSFRWPIYDNWYGVGRWQYSLKFNSTKESFLGLEKESCCWRFRVLWRRYANTVTGNADDTMETGIFLQIELKGLTGFGDKVDEFLEKNLKGYRRAE